MAKKQQINLNKVVDEGAFDASVRKLLDGLKYCPVLTTQEEKQLFRRYVQNGDVSAKKEIVRRNLKLVVRVSKAHWHKATVSYNVTDMIAEGVLGLSHAVDKFNPGKGYKFSTYAPAWIDQYVRYGVYNESTTIRFPKHLYDRRVKVSLAYKQLLEQKRERVERSTAITEVAQITSLKEEQVRAIEVIRPVSSLNVVNTFGGEEFKTELIDQIPASQEPSLEALSEHFERIRLRQLLGMLPERDATVVRQVYGIDCEPVQLKELASQLGITVQGVGNIPKRAIKVMRAIDRTLPLDLAS